MPNDFRLGEWLVEPARNQASRGAERAHLRPRVMDLLVYLAHHGGAVATKQEILEQVWKSEFVTESVLTAAVTELRHSFEDHADSPWLLETVPKRGYRLLPEVQWIDSRAASSRSTTQPAPSARASPRQPVFIGLFALATVALASFLLWRGSPESAVDSLAVLPLENFSGSAEQQHLADGLTEELITELARHGTLRVIARTSVMQYAGTKKTVPHIAEELGVSAVLGGSVQRERDRIRVSLQLVRARPEQHLWAETFDVPADDILTLRAHLAETTVRHVTEHVGGYSDAPRPSRAPKSSEALEAYLFGRSIAGQDTRAAYEKSLEYFERAIRLDPEYALAYAEAAESYAMLDFLEDVRSSRFETARTLSLKAVQLDPNLPEGLLRLADLRFYWDWDWSACDGGFRRARDVAPGSADVRMHYAFCLHQLGRAKEAITEMQRTRELDPLSSKVRRTLGGFLLDAGSADEAARHLRAALDLGQPTAASHEMLGRALLKAGRVEEAVDAFTAFNRARGAREVDDQYLREAMQAGGARGLLVAADEQKLESLQSELQQFRALAASGARVSPVAFARIFTGLGDLDSAFEWLQKGYSEHCPQLATLKSSPHWAPLHSDPRYTALLRKMKLPMD